MLVSVEGMEGMEGMEEERGGGGGEGGDDVVVGLMEGLVSDDPDPDEPLVVSGVSVIWCEILRGEDAGENEDLIVGLFLAIFHC